MAGLPLAAMSSALTPLAVIVTGAMMATDSVDAQLLIMVIWPVEATWLSAKVIVLQGFSNVQSPLSRPSPDTKVVRLVPVWARADVVYEAEISNVPRATSKSAVFVMATLPNLRLRQNNLTGI